MFGTMSSKKMITLKSLDGQTLEVEEVVAKKSLMIKNMIEDDDVMDDEVEDDDEDHVVHLRKVTYKVLEKAMEYCKRHVDEDENKVVNENELKAWDQDFVVKTDKSTLCNLLLAAYYLNIESLLLLLSKNAFHHKTSEGKKTNEDMRILLECQQ
ncbi:hypothetical protein ACLB2K_064193 [Fragaria x ananassa]